MNLYQKVRKRCAAAGITISELERRLGFPRGSIAKWDNNIPSVQKVEKVAEELGITIDTLIKDDEGGDSDE